VTNCLLAALRVPWTGSQTRIIAGPYPCTYADFVRAVATAAGLKPPRILPVPLWPLVAAAPLTRLPGLPRILADEIRRLAEDKAFDSDVLALTAQPALNLAEGLRQTFSAR